MIMKVKIVALLMITTRRVEQKGPPLNNSIKIKARATKAYDAISQQLQHNVQHSEGLFLQSSRSLAGNGSQVKVRVIVRVQRVR